MEVSMKSWVILEVLGAKHVRLLTALAEYWGGRTKLKPQIQELRDWIRFHYHKEYSGRTLDRLGMELQFLGLIRCVHLGPSAIILCITREGCEVLKRIRHLNQIYRLYGIMPNPWMKYLRASESPNIPIKRTSDHTITHSS